MRFADPVERWAVLVRTVLVGQPCWPYILKELKKLRECCVLEQEELKVQLKNNLYEAGARRSYSSVEPEVYQ